MKKQTRRSKSLNELRISEEDRRQTLMSNPNVSAQDLYSVLISLEEIKLERKESLKELRRKQLIKRKLHKEKARQRAKIKEESKDTLIEVKIEKLKETSSFNSGFEMKCKDEIWKERELMRRRRLGITDGGLQVSASVVSL